MNTCNLFTIQLGNPKSAREKKFLESRCLAYMQNFSSVAAAVPGIV